MGLFASSFIERRAASFSKDIQICLTDTDNGRGGVTHAYFPALSTCCAFLEYMTGLARGRLNNVGWKDVAKWASEYLPQPQYSLDVVRVLVCAFRNSVAHRGIASGVWCDKSHHGQVVRRVTWRLLETTGNPACQLVQERGYLTKDPPWPSLYTHRMHIHLRGLANDLVAGAALLQQQVARDARKQRAFEQAMLELYPDQTPDEIRQVCGTKRHE